MIYHGKNPPEEPPCGDCKPVLLPENEDAIKVYLMTRYQVVTAGMGTVVDIDFHAVKLAMEWMGVKDQRDCFFKVHHLFHEFRPREEK